MRPTQTNFAIPAVPQNEINTGFVEIYWRH